MTSEQNGPEMQAHQGNPVPPSPQEESSTFSTSSVPHGMGQSKSSRRRRRKRKIKGESGPPAPGGTEVQDVSSESSGSVPSVAASAAFIQHPSQNNGAGHTFQAGSSQHQNGSGTKRWKKKFRDRDRDRPRPSETPGNQSGFSSAASPSNGVSHANGAGGGIKDTSTHQFGNRSDSFRGRKGGGGGGGKQQRDRGPRSFVGPMDHSYRAVNGNFADTPPSTIDTGGNFSGRSNGHRASFHSDSQPVDYSVGKTVPIAEDAPTKIFFFIEDLFFIAKIQETARKTGVKVAFVKNDKDSVAALTSGEEEDRPGLIVFDLNNANAKPLTLIPKLKAKLKRSTSIIGFLSHLQGDLKAKATEAGCDTVMPRAAFSQNLPNLLRRYGLEEEEEANFNQ